MHDPPHRSPLLYHFLAKWLAEIRNKRRALGSTSPRSHGVTAWKRGTKKKKKREREMYSINKKHPVDLRIQNLENKHGIEAR